MTPPKTQHERIEKFYSQESMDSLIYLIGSIPDAGLRQHFFIWVSKNVQEFGISYQIDAGIINDDLVRHYEANSAIKLSLGLIDAMQTSETKYLSAHPILSVRKSIKILGRIDK